MFFKKNLILFFCFCSILQSLAQTNSKKWRIAETDSMDGASLLFEEANYLMALPIYENLYKSHPTEDYLKFCYGRCALYRSDKHEIALQLLSEVYEKNKKIENIEYYLALANQYNLKFDEAISFVEKCLVNKKTSTEIKKNSNQLLRNCLNAKFFYANPSTVKIENISDSINTSNEEYTPVITADESIMIYTYKGIKSLGGLLNAYQQPDNNGIYYEDIYQTIKENGQWVGSKPIIALNTNSNDAAIAISNNGQQLFVYREFAGDRGDIYVSYFSHEDWSLPQKLKGGVNTNAWEGSCSLSANGKQLYFSSDRSGGFGGKDIYRATLLADSTWGNIINLGDTINTALDDDAPFIHPDGVTLFYSSKGKNSMGGYDIFQSKLNITDSSFSSPKNLGNPINTINDELYYVLAADGERGYYSAIKQNGKGLKDIYTVTPGYVEKKPAVYLIKGKITAESAPSEANIVIEKSTNGSQLYGEFKSTSTGNYLVCLPKGNLFTITYKFKDFPKKVLEINTNDLDGYAEKIFDVNFSFADTIKLAQASITPVDKLLSTEVKTVSVIKDSINEINKKKITLTKKDTQLEPIKEISIKEKIVKEASVKKDTIYENDPKRNPAQIKNKKYYKLYKNISADGISFRVQLACLKYPKIIEYKHLKRFGKIENLLLGDGKTRVTIGGDFKTIGDAYIFSEKIITAGEKDAFVTVVYKGNRILLEDLEEMGIYKKK